MQSSSAWTLSLDSAVEEWGLLEFPGMLQLQLKVLAGPLCVKRGYFFAFVKEL